jgi:hypothetical protein
MKKLCVGLSILLLAAGVQAGNSKLMLGTADGLPGECEVGGYDVETGLVKLRAGSQTGTRPFDSFSADAQKKIMGWASDKAYEASNVLRIDIQKESAPTAKDKAVKDELVVYQISIENRSPFEITNIDITYRVFYEEVHSLQYNNYGGRFGGSFSSGGDNTTESKRVLTGKVSVTVAPNGKKTIAIPGVTIRDTRKDKAYTTEIYKGRLLGLFCELSKLSVSGETLERQVKDGSIPRETKWSEYKDEKAAARK